MKDRYPRIDARAGMLVHLVRAMRPELAELILETGHIETAVIGLGQQGTRHASLMRDYGTDVTAAVAPEQAGMVIHESIPVFGTISEMLEEHPGIAAASIWRHYSSAARAAIEAIEADIPIVVVITEGIPVRDVRDILQAARRRRTLVLGPNTPGIIFPPERVKVGMLPDVFYPSEPAPGRFDARGVSICSRSGAILYHMSDALASVGIAQNAVIGVGGDSAIGSPFKDVVPLAMSFPGTDLVVVAGEIGGCQEEVLAQDMREHPGRYPKPMVALISGRCAPAGKTMGHAGAIVAPGSAHGTHQAKREALEAAGVTVVNNQRDLIEAVQKALGGRTYFDPGRYYSRMKELWEAPPPVSSWGTCITRIEPNRISIRGEPLEDLIGNRCVLEVAHLLVAGTLPDANGLAELNQMAARGIEEPVPQLEFEAGDDISKQIAAFMLADRNLARLDGTPATKVAYSLGRVCAYLARIFGRPVPASGDFPARVSHVMTGRSDPDYGRVRLIEAMMVASVDHGVTPPSAQATILAASVRAAFEVSLASGVSGITDVHGGAGARAAEFFRECADLAQREQLSLFDSTVGAIRNRLDKGIRIEGLGHRVHTRDPRRDVLWKLADSWAVSGQCTQISREVEKAFETVRGMTLPVNVDGVIGAITADMDLDPRVAKALFLFGRVAGLAAHYFEEVSTQLPMRRIDYSRAVYRGP